ncbi:hypothetical protein [Abyssibacter profundi]|uniref:hypothetical protein n=1 Tax=Abyssibacter profundi TaxID=2182787 RepID=UPI0014032A86|nr:hypothetical protein [Abyssibacter profundi]
MTPDRNTPVLVGAGQITAPEPDGRAVVSGVGWNFGKHSLWLSTAGPFQTCSKP